MAWWHVSLLAWGPARHELGRAAALASRLQVLGYLQWRCNATPFASCGPGAVELRLHRSFVDNGCQCQCRYRCRYRCRYHCQYHCHASQTKNCRVFSFVLFPFLPRWVLVEAGLTRAVQNRGQAETENHVGSHAKWQKPRQKPRQNNVTTAGQPRPWPAAQRAPWDAVSKTCIEFQTYTTVTIDQGCPYDS